MGIGVFVGEGCANDGYNLDGAADEARIEKAAEQLRKAGVEGQAVETDLATVEGVDRLYAAADGRPIDLLLANAGRGLGGDFREQDFAEARRGVDTNIIGTLYLIWRVGGHLRSGGERRIFITRHVARS